MEVSLIGTIMRCLYAIILSVTGTGFVAWSRDMHCNSRSPDWLPWDRNNQSETLHIFGFGWSRQDAWHGIWTTDTQNNWADSGEWILYRQFLGILVLLFWVIKLFSGRLVYPFLRKWEISGKWFWFLCCVVDAHWFFVVVFFLAFLHVLYVSHKLNVLTLSSCLS